MYTEEVQTSPITPHYKKITRNTAIEQIQNFRHALKHGGLKHDRTFGMVHRKPHIESYLDNEYLEIIAHEEAVNGPHPNHDWVLGYFYMLDKYNKIVFCVAPILIPKHPHRGGAKDPEEITVWDPLDPNCPYRYTYGINADPELTDDDGPGGFYDMGEMWP